MDAVDVRRADGRFVSRAPGRESRYSFSYAEHYEAGNTHHGLLLANNDEALEPGGGYDEHPHRQLEIVTWVLAGTLTHRDSTGESLRVPAGWVQVMSAGHGVVHSETNAEAEPVRYLQMWVAPDGSRTEPGYDRHPLEPGPLALRLTPPGQPDAGFVVARPGLAEVTLRATPFRHLFVATGHVDVEQVGTLTAGDAVRFTAVGEHRVRGSEDSQIGVWEMGSRLGGKGEAD